jgi:hypothetical protein
MDFTHTITTNGIETPISADRAAALLKSNAIYQCDDLSCAREDEIVYHVSPETELEKAYADETAPFG